MSKAITITSLTQPKIIRDIHRAYFEAVLRIVETILSIGTFHCHGRYQMEDLGLRNWIKFLRNWHGSGDEFTHNPEKPRFVTGCFRANMYRSISPDAIIPVSASEFDPVGGKAYLEAISVALVDGGSDRVGGKPWLIPWTPKAAVFASWTVFRRMMCIWPWWFPGTITDLPWAVPFLGKTAEGLLEFIVTCTTVIIGLNCALGAGALRSIRWASVEFFYQLCQCSPQWLVLPNDLVSMMNHLKAMAIHIKEMGWIPGFLNIIGLAVGTTPAHIKSHCRAVEGVKPRQRVENKHILSLVGWNR